ncbi:hypothetical protein LXL04_018624 [Taraxacum kok-saghyz]
MILISPISRRIYLDSVVSHSISTQSYTSISIKIIDHSSVSNPKTYHQRRILLPCYASITGSTSPSPPRYPNPPSSHLRIIDHSLTPDTSFLCVGVSIFEPQVHTVNISSLRWYQIKITMRWEDADYASSVGTPSRVVQYDAPDLGSDTVLGLFNLSLAKFEGPVTSAVILKFELLYTPILEIGSNMQDSLEVSPAAVHEFKIPPKALLGVHTYCPVHFDAFHAVLVDTTVHISLLKGGVHTMKTPSRSNSLTHEEVLLVKAFLISRANLLQELRNLSKAINQAIDLSDFTSQNDESETTNADSQVPEKMKIVSKIPNGSIDHQSEYLYTLQHDELYRLFHSLGDQILYLWSTFLKFHRANKTKVLEHLRNSWAVDRRAEWSIWMVYSKVEMPHQPIRSAVDDSAYHAPASF